MKPQRKLELSTIIIQAKDIVASDIDGEKVMMNIDKGKYYALNSIGSCIWELIESPKLINEIIMELQKEYDVDIYTCSESVLTFLKRLYDEGLVSIA